MTHPKLLISSYLVFTLFTCVLTLILNSYFSYLMNRTLWAVLFKILKSKHKDRDRREVWPTFGIRDSVKIMAFYGRKAIKNFLNPLQKINYFPNFLKKINNGNNGKFSKAI